MEKKLLVVTKGNSDLFQLMCSLDSSVTTISPYEPWDLNMNEFEAIALLGGNQNEPMLLSPRNRNILEQQIANGKRVFAEYVGSIRHVYFAPPEETRFERLVVRETEASLSGVAPLSLLDNQSTFKISPHKFTVSCSTPVLSFVKVHAHDRITLSETQHLDESTLALWFESPDNLLVCAFQLSNFIRSRFAPKRDIVKLVEFILSWLYQAPKPLPHIEFDYSTGKKSPVALDFHSQILQAAGLAMEWYHSSGILLEDGRGGVLEGLRTEIDVYGRQRVSNILRADCIGESAGAFFLHWLLTEDQHSKQISDNLTDLLFDGFQCQENGPLFGMVRWTNEAWGVCYQDDVARAILPQLLQCFILQRTDRLEECVNALRFLVQTTGSDGTRGFRTDAINLTDAEMKRLRSQPGNLPSAHYNAYYYAALLLGYKLTQEQCFLDTAVRGMTTIMSVYPDTKREQSQTEECCRLVLPLSWLYWITKDELHSEWLYRVSQDLQKFLHPSGAYLEWDEGYSAAMRHDIGTGESSLISANGDPVVDLLYSNNWLPMAWIQAYFVTKDEWFRTLWETSAKFMLRAQVHSHDKHLHGAWARAYDVERDEVFGTPSDVGWGPWAIESGWTVGEIASGLMMGLLTDKLEELYS